MGPLLPILGGLAAGAGGQLIGGALGGGGPTYEPSKTMEDLSEYGRNQLRATKQQKQVIRAEAKTYSSPGAKEAFLQSYLGSLSNPEFIQKQLTRSYKKPIDYQTGGYRDLASFAYGKAVARPGVPFLILFAGCVSITLTYLFLHFSLQIQVFKNSIGSF